MASLIAVYLEGNKMRLPLKLGYVPRRIGGI